MDNSINKYLERLKKAVNKTKQNMATDALKTLITTSPVRTGSYIKSHQVGIDTIIAHHEPVYHEIQPGIPEAAVTALKSAMFVELNGEVQNAKFDNTIYISNSIPYANQVEYIGWMFTPAYHPYGIAMTTLKAKSYLKHASNAPAI
jgi:hypothetical protein